MDKLLPKFYMFRTSFFFFSIILGAKDNLKVAQLCPTLCDPMDYTDHGIL